MVPRGAGAAGEAVPGPRVVGQFEIHGLDGAAFDEAVTGPRVTLFIASRGAP